MGRGRCPFTQAAVTRALKGAKEAGVKVRIDIDAARKLMTITSVDDVTTGAPENEWNEVFEQHGKGHAKIRK